MLRDRLLFFAPLALAAAALALMALAQSHLQLNLPLWAYVLALTGTACISWRASGWLDGSLRGVTRLDWQRAGIMMVLGLTLSASMGLLRCGITGQPIAACLARSITPGTTMAIVLTATLLEEILLRGHLGRLLGQLGTPVLLQLALQGSLFALTHGGATSSSRLALYFAAGALLTLLAIATQGLLASLSLHIAWTACQWLVPGDLRGTGLASDQIAAAVEASHFAGAAALLLVAAAVWRRWMPPAPPAATGLAPLRR